MLFIKLKKRLERWIWKRRYQQPKDWVVDLKSLHAFVGLLDSKLFADSDLRRLQQTTFQTTSANSEELILNLMTMIEYVSLSGQIPNLKTLVSFQPISLDDFLIDAKNYSVDLPLYVSQLKTLTRALIVEIHSAKAGDGLESYYTRKLQVLFIEVFNLTEALLSVVID